MHDSEAMLLGRQASTLPNSKTQLETQGLAVGQVAPGPLKSGVSLSCGAEECPMCAV